MPLNLTFPSIEASEELHLIPLYSWKKYRLLLPFSKSLLFLQLALSKPVSASKITFRITSRTTSLLLSTSPTPRINTADRWKMKERPVAVVVVVERIRGGEGTECNQLFIHDA